MRNTIRVFASAMLLVLASTVFSFCVGAQEVPKQLQPPANERLLLQLHAKGNQVYTCKSDAAQFTWISVLIPKAGRRRPPDATLGTPARKSAFRIQLTTSSTHRNSFPFTLRRPISDSWCLQPPSAAVR